MAHRYLPALIALALPGSAFAFHDLGAPASASTWNFEPWLVALIGGSALLYVVGVLRLWRNAGVGRGIRKADVGRFAAGWLALAAALLSPLDPLAGGSFALHMVQHELLMVVAAPLLVLGRPLEAWAWALPGWAQRAMAGMTRARVVRALWGWLTEPVGAWCFHALALWAWHVPVLFTAALASQPLHALQHACFFGSALAFWWAVFGRAARTPDGMSIASLFTTMLHTGALGALLTFAPAAIYLQGAPSLPGLSALEDQQLGGLVMWAPGSLAYLVAGLAIVARWLRAAPPPRPRTADSPARS